jgi:hypothetical protein
MIIFNQDNRIVMNNIYPYESTYVKPTLSIGDTYGGGIVFYITAPVAGATSGTSGLISKTTDMDGTAIWGCMTQVVGTLSTIGSGNQNTIKAHDKGCFSTPVAANYCYDLTDGTYSDWWLPSQDELRQMFIQKNVIGGFAPDGYWSSTEVTEHVDYAKSIDLATGTLNWWRKNTAERVRAIRQF